MLKRDAIVLPCLILVGCADDTITITAESAHSNRQAPTWEQFRDSSRLVSEGGVVVFVIEGDIAVDESTLMAYYRSQFVDQVEKSSVLTRNGIDQVWTATEKLDITYCVSDSWGSQKAMALADLQEATAQWMSAANVVYRYVPDQDSTCTETNTGVHLNVIPWSSGGLACIPHDCRYIKMEYGDGWDKYTWLGAWTHEVGHTLGLWHEHVRAECGVNEGVTVRDLTSYDLNSSLHYSTECNSGSVGQMTDLDKQGLASLYGSPASPSIAILPAAWIGAAQSAIN